jgi:hypothetical protein
MKRALIILAMTFALVAAASGQATEYYAETRTFDLEVGVTYRCIHKGPVAFLFNDDNIYHDKPMTYADGRQLEIVEGWIPQPKPFTMTKECHEMIQALSKAAFTTEQKAFLKGDVFGITLFIDPDSGKLMEVEFSFAAKGSMVSCIPPATFRQLEQDLKDGRIVVQPTDYGRSLNYIMAGYNIHF